jgi:uncharacterized protein (TIGR02996 family)
VLVTIRSVLGGERSLETRNQIIDVGSRSGSAVYLGEDPAIAPRHADLVPGIDAVAVRPVDGEVRVDGAPLVTATNVAYGQRIEVGATALWLEPRWERPVPAAWTGAPPPTAWGEVLGDTPVEHGLLAALRERPGDDATRSVYADWMLEHGRAAAAEELRGAVIDPRALVAETTPAWRAIVGCREIAGCARSACPRLWSALAATDNERARSCARCAHTVRYCVEVRDVCSAIARGERVVADAALAHADPYVVRVDAALRTASDPDWIVGGAIDDAWWSVDLARDVLTTGFTVRVGVARLHVYYGGNDAGMIDFAGPPRHRTAELSLARLDDAALVEWLSFAFRTLPPSVSGYS